ncbi:unnamed protein product [Caenorhabditis brenneri]
MIHNTIPAMSDHGDEVRRFHQYKNSDRLKLLHQHRSEHQVKIRKQKGDNLLQKRRNIIDESPAKQVTSAYQPIHIVCVVKGNQQVIDATFFQMLKETLKYEFPQATPSDNEVVNSEVLSILIQALNTPIEDVQNDVLHCLDKIVISSPEQIPAMSNLGVVNSLIQLSMHSSLKLAKCAITTLSNIAATEVKYCDEIMENSQIQEAVANWIDRIDELGYELLAWTFSNIGDYYSMPSELCQLLVKGIGLMIQCPNNIVRLYACSALKTLLESSEEEKEAVRTSGVLPLLIPLLLEKALALPVVEILVELRATDLEFLDLTMFAEFMKYSNSSIKQECCKVISVIAAESKPAETLVINAGFIPIVIDILEKEEFNCQLEAAKFLYKLSNRGMPNTVSAILPVVPVLCQLLKNNRCPDMLEPLLETFYIILFTTQNYHIENMSSLLRQVEEYGGNCAIDELLLFPSKKIVDLSCSINLQFFTDGIPSEENDVVEDDPRHRFWF